MSTVPLRVFDPDPSSGSIHLPVSPEEKRRRRRRRRRRWRLRDLYDRHVLPRVIEVRSRPLDPETIRFYLSALARWEAHSADPPLDRIDEAVGAAWLGAMRAAEWRGRRLSDATIRRHAKYIQAILDCAGPDRMHGRRRIRGARILPARRIPYLVPDPVDLPVRRPYTLDHLWSWIDYLRTRGTSLRVPGLGVEPAAWLESWLIFLHNTGARPAMAWHVERAHLEPDGRWLVAPKELVKGQRRALELYLNEPARRAIERVRVAGKDRLFGVGLWRDRKPLVYAAMRIDMARAGLPWLGFYGIRRLFSTLMVGSRQELIGAWMMGHAPPREVRIQAQHYAHRRTLIAAAMDAHPQPGLSRQKTLF